MSRGVVRAAGAATLVAAALVAAPAAGAEPAAVDLDHGTLTIEGDAAAEALTLRARPASPRRWGSPTPRPSTASPSTPSPGTTRSTPRAWPPTRSSSPPTDPGDPR
jgi:hypothetical protein